MTPPAGRRFNLESAHGPQPGGVLDDLTGSPQSPAGPAAQPGRTPVKQGKARIDPKIDAVLVRRVKGAVIALGYREPGWTSLAVAVEAALLAYVTEAEATHNNGQPFPFGDGQHLKSGPRFKQ